MRSREISFSAPSSYINGAETKTAYSGIVSGGREEINWVTGDRVRIHSDQASTPAGVNYADYDVALESSSSSSNISSTASLEPVGGRGTGLWWGSGTHNFYAVYPSPSTTGMSSNVNMSGNTVTFTIPSSQTYTASGTTLKPDMNYAYMWAAIRTAESTGLSLKFKPMFTAFEITFDCGEQASKTLSSFTLSSASTAMSGNCSATITAAFSSSSSTVSYSGFSAAITANRRVTVSFGSGLTVTKGNPVTFTIFALPHSYSDLTISYTTTGNQTFTLPLKKNGSFVTFNTGVKYKITNLSMPDDWVYSIERDMANANIAEVTGGSYTMYNALKSTKTRGTVTRSVPIKVQWSTASTGPFTDGTPTGVTVRASSAGVFSGSNTNTKS